MIDDVDIRSDIIGGNVAPADAAPPRRGLALTTLFATTVVVCVLGGAMIGFQFLLDMDRIQRGASETEHALITVVTGGIGVLILAAVVALVVHRLVVRPFIALADALDAVSPNGPRIDPIRIPKGHDGDELGGLTRGINGLLGRFADTLERQRAATAAVLAREIHLRGVMDNIGEGIVTIDLETNIRSMNPAAARLFGHDRARVTGMPLRDLLELDDYHRFLAALPDSLEEVDEASGVRRREVTAVRRDGARVPASLTVRLMRVEGDETFICVVRDISAHKEAERSVRESEARLNLAVTATRSGIWDLDLRTGACWWSPEFVAMLGYDDADIPHRNGVWESLVHPADREWLTHLAEGFIAGTVNEFQPVYRLRQADGSWAWIEAKGHCARDDLGRPVRFIGTMADVTDRKRHEEQVMFMASHDALTGLPNRAFLTDHLDRAVAAAQRAGRHVAALVIDVDRFKLVNDSAGHAMGDEYLRRLADRVGLVTRINDTFGRMGADEFLIIAEDLACSADALAIATAVRHAAREPFYVNGTPHFTSLSIGIATHDGAGAGDADRPMNGAVLARHANAAMRAAKAEGGNGIRFFSPDMNAEAAARLEMERALRAAIDGDQFVVHYQPKFAVSGLAVVGLEALVRWNHPRDGLVPPAQFIPLAEETGLIAAIGTLVQARAIDQIAQWRARGVDPLPIAVNVSARQLAGEDSSLPVLAMLERADVAPRWLELEITETMMMSNLDTITRAMAKLRDHGVRVSVDDFGTGHSSLAYLRQLPISTLKIDRSFIKDVDSDEDATTIAAAIISMGRQLGLTVVAEGIEDERQLEFLRRHDCDQAQGFLLARPMPVEELERRHLAGGQWVARGLGGRDGHTDTAPADIGFSI